MFVIYFFNNWLIKAVITYADDSRTSKAYSGVCVCALFCVCKIKTADNTITVLATVSK